MASPSLQFVPSWLRKPTTPGLDSPATPSAFAFGNGPASPRHPLGNVGSVALGGGQGNGEEFSLHLPYQTNGNHNQMNGVQAKANRSKGSRPQRYSKDQMLALVDSEKSRNLPSDLEEWTIQLGINGVVNAVGQHGGQNVEGGDGGDRQTGDDGEGHADEEGRPYPHHKRYIERERSQSGTPRRGQLTASALNSPDLSRPGRSLGGFGRGEGGGAFGGSGDASHGKGNRFGILEGDSTDLPAGARERKERNPWRDAEAGFRDRDRQERADRAAEKAEREGGMSAGGRYIPANGTFASPSIEKAGLSERRGVRTTLVRRDTAEAVGDKDATATPTRNLNQSSSTWRPNLRHTPSAASASFEGVLGSFGAAVATPSKQKTFGENGGPLDSPGQGGWKERERVASATDAANGIMPGSGGGPGWGKTGRWRSAAAQQDEDIKRPNLAPLGDRDEDPKPTESTAVIPPATPVDERDHQLDEHNSANVEQFVSSVVDEPHERQIEQVSQPAEADPETIEWFYRDPSGLEQGPFKGKQMQEWFSASYFSNDLPLRRASENTFRSLQIIKEETRSDDRPFLTKTAPKLPPNLPIPGFAGNNMLGQPSPSIGQASLSNGSDTLPPNDTLRQMLADLQQTQLGGQHIQTPMRNAVLGAASPAISVGRIATDPFANPASYASSPVSQHAMPARSAWETAASPALSRAAVSSPFGGAQHLGGFPQPQFAQQRSIFDVPSPQQPLGQAPYPPSPWGMQMPPQMAHQMHQQPFPTSPFAQMPQQPFAPYPGQPMNQPWQQPQFMQPPQQQQQPMGSPAAMPQHPGQQLAAPETPVAQPQSVSPVPAPQQVLSPSPASAQPALELAKSPVPATAVVTSPVPAVSIPTPTPQAWATIPAVVASPIVQKSEPERIPEFERIVSPVPVKAAPAPIAAKPSKEEKQVKAVEAAAQPIQPESRTSTPPIAAPSVAPWAEDKGKANKSMSLKEIQEVEAKAAEKKKAVEAKARAAAAAAQPIADSTEMLQSITYGLASRPAMTTSNSTGAASLPVWGATTPTGSKKQMPKRSLQQIQEEEHAKKLAQVKAAASSSLAEAAQSAGTRRGYADLAAATPSPSTGAGWATVGAGGKVATPAASSPAITAAKPKAAPAATSMITGAVSNKAPVAKPKAQILNEVNPSIEFVRWTKEQLKGLTGANVDEFIQMLLTFPVEPPHKDEMLEIIAESVYANSSTLDGKRFANNFYTKRKEDAIDRVGAGSKNGAAKVTSLADIVKTQPKAPGSDFGFKVVKKKGKKN